MMSMAVGDDPDLAMVRKAARGYTGLLLVIGFSGLLMGPLMVLIWFKTNASLTQLALAPLMLGTGVLLLWLRRRLVRARDGLLEAMAHDPTRIVKVTTAVQTAGVAATGIVNVELADGQRAVLSGNVKEAQDLMAIFRRRCPSAVA
jgi:hypothetical protein